MCDPQFFQNCGFDFSWFYIENYHNFERTADYGISGCGIFKAGIQNWKGFCIKIICSQMKLLNFENWTSGEPQ